MTWATVFVGVAAVVAIAGVGVGVAGLAYARSLQAIGTPDGKRKPASRTGRDAGWVDVDTWRSEV